MVYNLDRLWVYLAPPRTGSTTLHQVLTGPPFHGVYGEWHASRWDQASKSPEPAWRYRFLSVRNPYSRTVSMWRVQQMDAQMSLGTYVRACLRDLHSAVVPSSGMFLPEQFQAEYAKGCDGAVHLETLRQDLTALPIYSGEPFELPKLHTTDDGKPYWRECYDEATAALVAEHFRRDFETFGYDPGSWRTNVDAPSAN